MRPTNSEHNLVKTAVSTFRSVIRFGFLTLALACGIPRSSVGAESASHQSVLKIGGGGWLVGLDIAPDGQRLVRTDTYGAYLWDGKRWNQLMTQTRLPAADFGFYPTNGTMYDQNSGGIYEIGSAPNSTVIIYLYAGSKLFVSTDRGATFTNTGFKFTHANNVNGAYRMNGRKMAIDPYSPDHVYLGTDRDGIFETRNGTNRPRATFTAVAALPTAGSSSAGYPGYNIAFDPSSPHTCQGSLTCTIYVFAYSEISGVPNGKVWKSNDGGTTWVATTGGPTTVEHMVVAPNDGTLWVTDAANSIASGGNSGGGAGGSLWKYISGMWTKVTGAGNQCHAVAVNQRLPANVICVHASGGLKTSNDAGLTWSNPVYSIASSDVPWLADAGGALYMSVGDVIFDATLPHTFLASAGIGVWEAQIAPLKPVPFKYYSTTVGIEQLVSQHGIAPNGVAVVGTQDRSTWYLESPDSYPTQSNTYHSYIPLMVAWGLSYSPSSTNFMTVLNSPSALSGGNVSGYSNDGGKTWHQFASFDVTVSNSALRCSGGHPQFTLASTTGLTTWSKGSGTIVRVISQGANGNHFYPIKVGSNTISLENVDCSSSVFPMAAPNYQIVAPTQPLNNRNGAYAVTNISNNGSGVIRVTMKDLQYDTGIADLFCFSGIVGTGGAAPNGCWVVSNTNNTTFVDLFGSSFSGAYTHGGMGVKTLPRGGYTATASPTNFVVVPAQKNYPLCTTDGGATWNELKVPVGVPYGASTGWIEAFYLNNHTAVADSVIPNTFYGYNFLQGTYKWTFCNPPELVSSFKFPASSYNATLVAVPNKAGHLFFVGGRQGTPGQGHPQAYSAYRSTDGGAHWSAIPNVQEPMLISFGATKSGETYPTCYLVGWINQGKGYAYGIWRSTNLNLRNPTWTQVGPYPLGSMDAAWVIMADGLTWNKWYLGWGGSGWTYGQQD